MEYKIFENSKLGRKDFVKGAKQVLEDKACLSSEEFQFDGDIQQKLRHSLYRMKYEKDRCRYLVVCYDEDKAIGSMLLLNSCYPIFNDIVFEAHIFVKKEYRGKGVAAQMLKTVLENTDIKKQYIYSRGPYFRDFDPFFYKNEIGILNFEIIGLDIDANFYKRRINKTKAREQIKIVLDWHFKETQWYKVIYSFYRGVTYIRCNKIQRENERQRMIRGW